MEKNWNHNLSFEAQQYIAWHLATGQPMWNILVSYCSSGRTLKKFLFIFFWPLLHFLYLKTVIHNKAEPLCGKTEMLSPGKTVRPKKTFHQNIFVCLCKFDGMSCIVKPPDSTSVRYVRKVASRAPPDNFILDIFWNIKDDFNPLCQQYGY